MSGRFTPRKAVSTELRILEDEDTDLVTIDPEYAAALADERLWQEVEDAAALCEELATHGLHVAFTGASHGHHGLQIEIRDLRGRCVAVVPTLAVLEIDEVRRLAGV
jgi:hypothetical protein